MDNRLTPPESASTVSSTPATPDSIKPQPRRNIFSFIIKIWVDQAHSGAWHGHISGVHNGNGRYFRSFSQIGRYISAYIFTAGVRLSPSWLARMIEWMQSFRKHPPKHSA